MDKIIKRFISGVSCPQCHKFDVIQLWKENNNLIQECVSCHYRKILSSEQEKQIPINFKEN